MGIAEAITAVAQLANRVLGRVWGTRTQAEDSIEHELEREEAAFQQAIHNGDAQSATAVYERLVRLRDKALRRRLK